WKRKTNKWRREEKRGSVLVKGVWVREEVKWREQSLHTLECVPYGRLSADLNIAKGGNVVQSSLGWNGVPERAIDGNRASIYGQDSCTHTQNDVKPWWRLDLLKTFKINTVTITNRKDCCHDRINGAEIRIGNSLNDNGNDNPR
ncbi:hypothetical protein FQN60_016957, partial [Etheostoma spectabile]